jgi:hypothetical protein
LHQRLGMNRAAAALAATLAASLLLLRLDAPAEACSAPAPLSEDGLLPAPGATEVPLNTRVMVRLHGEGALDTYRVVLRAADGTEVPGTPRHVSGGFETHAIFVTPDALLAPRTTYEVLDNLGGDLVVLGSFVTGETTDTTPPAFDGAFEQTVGHESCNGGDCCGVYDANTYQLGWTAATDASPVIYELVNGHWPDDRVETTRTLVIGVDVCYAESPSLGPDHDLAHGGYVIVRAVDLAGNGSEPVAVYAVDECSHPPYCDGGWSGGETDAGVHGRDGGNWEDEEPPTGRIGCSIGAGASSSGGAIAAWLGLLALALVVIARRRGRE